MLPAQPQCTVLVTIRRIILGLKTQLVRVRGTANAQICLTIFERACSQTNRIRSLLLAWVASAIISPPPRAVTALIVGKETINATARHECAISIGMHAVADVLPTDF